MIGRVVVNGFVIARLVVVVKVYVRWVICYYYRSKVGGTFFLSR